MHCICCSRLTSWNSLSGPCVSALRHATQLYCRQNRARNFCKPIELFTAPLLALPLTTQDPDPQMYCEFKDRVAAPCCANQTLRQRPNGEARITTAFLFSIPRCLQSFQMRNAAPELLVFFAQRRDAKFVRHGVPNCFEGLPLKAERQVGLVPKPKQVDNQQHRHL